MVFFKNTISNTIKKYTIIAYSSCIDRNPALWKYNRLLLYNILNYHNINNHSIASVNNDLKCIIRAIKLIVVKPDEEEIRSKYSALQIAIGDLERFKDDFNNIVSVNELKSDAWLLQDMRGYRS